MVGVSDGDTITVLDDAKAQHKIRFAGINAPEKGQAFGERSKQSLSALIFQKRVEARCHKKDRYGREVCAGNLRLSVAIFTTVYLTLGIITFLRQLGAPLYRFL